MFIYVDIDAEDGDWAAGMFGHKVDVYDSSSDRQVKGTMTGIIAESDDLKVIR